MTDPITPEERLLLEVDANRLELRSSGLRKLLEATADAGPVPEPPTEPPVDPPPPDPPPTPVPDPPPPDPPASEGRGPKGAWPLGFPAYAAPADIVTDGTPAGLRTAITALETTGGIVEHPADINFNDYNLDRTGKAPTVIRPPLGKRGDYKITSGIRIKGEGLLLAGWHHTAGSIRIYDHNSGAAWLEGDKGAQFRTYTGAGNVDAEPVYILCEAVWRDWATNVGHDRIVLNTQYSGVDALLDARGLWVAGHTRPVGSDAHVDTIQIVPRNGGTGRITIRDSVIWPSSNVAMQGGGGPAAVFELINVWACEPRYAKSFGQNPDGALDGYNVVTGSLWARRSTLLGSTHPDSAVDIGGSELFDTGNYVDKGGNTVLAALTHATPPPPAPTTAQLDQIWHP